MAYGKYDEVVKPKRIQREDRFDDGACPIMVAEVARALIGEHVHEKAIYAFWSTFRQNGSKEIEIRNALGTCGDRNDLFRSDQRPPLHIAGETTPRSPLQERFSSKAIRFSGAVRFAKMEYPGGGVALSGIPPR
ncbi:hypothetical protein DM992_07285 [Burkholderia sp. JP2-270]|nr:hypothetical protein DM992_07285 [Burkholderia sp. JP2-270]